MSAAPNFDRLAGPYRWLEYFSFGPFLWRCRVRFLPELAGRRRALVLGDGDGRFTAALLRSNPEIHVHAVDLSPAMMRTLTSAAKTSSTRLTTEIADLRAWSPSPESKYDLIVTHFFLDCLTSAEVTSLALRIGPSAAPGALWVVSDFSVPHTRFGKLVARPVVSGLYLAFRWLTGLRLGTLPDHAHALNSAGWHLQIENFQLHGLLVSQLWELRPLPGGRPTGLE